MAQSHPSHALRVDTIVMTIWWTASLSLFHCHHGNGRSSVIWPLGRKLQTYLILEYGWRPGVVAFFNFRPPTGIQVTALLEKTCSRKEKKNAQTYSTSPRG